MKNTIFTTFPVLPIRNAVVFPSTALPLRVGRAKSIAAVEKARKSDLRVVLVTQKTSPNGNENDSEEATASNLHRVGTLCQIEKVRGSAKDGYQVMVRGLARFRISELIERDGALLAEGTEWADEHDVDTSTEQALLAGMKEMSAEVLELLPGNTTQLAELVEGITDLVFLTHLCSANIELTLEKKQRLLETVSLKARVLSLMDTLREFRDNLSVQGEIRSKLDSKLGKQQREHILREQLRAIREELGDGDEAGKSDDYRKKIEEAAMPEETRKIALEELKRLEAAGSASPESHVIRNYLDLLCALPWGKSAPDSAEAIDLDRARGVLDDDHYGLVKIKKRILQHLAVMKLIGTKPDRKKKGSILLFVGPPGVGKTSLGQSIARALGRKFLRVSLGGVRDDAEIRGHRRTYIGAMPGRIIQGLKRAGENNPVMMLDEIDKLGASFQGDPAAALLEVLDPEQNQNFHDHYLDVPFDLSKVFFIATANSLETIPRPLLDRMEVIELSGYTTAEKLHIAKSHLVPKQLAEHGLAAEQLAISDEALLRVINAYTREAGVRELARGIAALCRASSERVLASGEKTPVRVEVADLDEALGPERFVHEVAERISPPGVVTGLAWTPVGGEILFIEASLMPGTGRLILTGQLGDVMKESAQIALSLVKSRLPHLVPKEAALQSQYDVHVHVPSGAIPKDGPSAGITMVTTIASLFSGRVVDPKLAMTGEITLRGVVMPVGGIKEKVLAAHRAGITRVILSKRNEKDLREVPEEVRSTMRFEIVETVDEVLRLALGLEPVATDLVRSPMGQWNRYPQTGAA